MLRSRRRNRHTKPPRPKPRHLDRYCPACGVRDVFHSRTKTFLEKFLKRTGVVRYYRCHTCDWRGPRASIEGVVKAVLLAIALLLLLLSLFIARARPRGLVSELGDFAVRASVFGWRLRG